MAKKKKTKKNTLFLLGQNRLDKLMDFAKEPGMHTFAKVEVFPAVSRIAQQHPERRNEIIEWFREYLRFAAEKLPETQYIDSTLAGMIMNEVIDLKAIELQEEIKAVFDTGLVDLGSCGDYHSVIKDITDQETPVFYKAFETDVFKRFKAMGKYSQ